jgi:hypothetical protein
VENKTPIALIWVLAFCGLGALILGLSSLIDEQRFYKHIVESAGDGLFLLGLIDLFFQTRVLSWLTKPAELQTLVENVKGWTAAAHKVNESFENIHRKEALEKIAKQNEEILNQLKALRVGASQSAP